MLKINKTKNELADKLIKKCGSCTVAEALQDLPVCRDCIYRNFLISKISLTLK